jgi:hypothetical protein
VKASQTKNLENFIVDDQPKILKTKHGMLIRIAFE